MLLYNKLTIRGRIRNRNEYSDSYYSWPLGVTKLEIRRIINNYNKSFTDVTYSLV